MNQKQLDDDPYWDAYSKSIIDFAQIDDGPCDLEIEPGFFVRMGGVLDIPSYCWKNNPCKKRYAAKRNITL
jgi:hypothetical protein